MWRELYDKHADDLEALVRAQDIEALRAFFALSESIEEKVVKAIMWGRFFLPDFFQDVTPPFHFELARDYFSEKDEYTAAPRGFAKAQSLDSKVLTPTGWVRMGDIKTGDYVMGADGKKKRVEGMSPITEMDLYRLSTRDGRSTLCNLDHLWEVTCPSNTGDRKIVKTTREILKNFESLRFDKRDGRTQVEYRYFIDSCKPLEFDEKELPIDPYTLGVWLGNGTSASGSICSNDPEIFDYLPYDSHKTKAPFMYSVRKIQALLRENGLLNNKHIPDIYKLASIEQRSELLRGLIDTDGSVLKNGLQFTYSSARKRLFDDVVDLVRSLGGTVTSSEQLTRFDSTSDWKHSYRFSARIIGINPFKLKRKSSVWKGSLRTKAAITSIKFEKRGLGRCIKVEDELYITDDYLVTHNTSLYQSLISYEIANKLQTFIVLIEKSFGEASEVLATIRMIFADNVAIKQVYGSLIKVGDSGEIDDKSKDAQGDLFINGVRLRSKGFNAPIRGLKSKQYRPSKIILDDIESDEHIESSEQRRKYADNFMQGIVPAKDVDGTIKYIGTILHHDSLLMNLIKTHTGKIFKAFDPLDPENTLLWPERWTYERLMKRKKEMEINGQGQNKFYQEYLNTPIDDERRDFRMEDLDVFFKREDLEGKTCNRYICIDAADSKKDGSDYTGVVVVDIDYLNNWYIQFVKRYRVNSKELVELIFNLWEYWKPRKIGVEKNAFADQVKPWLDELKEERNVFPIVEELMDGGKRKEDRIRGALQGRLESRKIYFRKEAKDDTMALRGEFIDFPYAKHDDLIDALCYIAQIGTRPFGAPNEVMTTTEQEFWKSKKAKTKSLRNRF